MSSGNTSSPPPQTGAAFEASRTSTATTTSSCSYSDSSSSSSGRSQDTAGAAGTGSLGGLSRPHPPPPPPPPQERDEDAYTRRVHRAPLRPSPPPAAPDPATSSPRAPPLSPSPSPTPTVESRATATTGDLYSLQSPSPDAADPSTSGGSGSLSTSGSGVVPPLSLSEALRRDTPHVPGGGSASPSLPMAPQHSQSASSTTPSPSPSFSMSTASGSSGGYSANPHRTLNPAFLTLSPRAGSESSAASELSSRIAVMRLETDKGDDVEVVQCDLTTLEDRKVFVTQQSAELAWKMTSARIVDSLLPALLTAFACDDYSESFDSCAPSIAKVLPSIIEALDDRTTPTITYFIGLIMELCCSAENSVLREVTVALAKIIQLLEDQVVIDLFLPLVLSMRVSFWSTPRAVAAGLLGLLAARPAVLRASDMPVAVWFDCFVESGRDPCVLVREAAVQALHQWIATADAHRVPYVEMPLPMVKEFVTDDLSDTVRYLLVQQLVELGRLVGKEATSKYLQGIYTAACGDPSWRVRFIAAQCMGQIAGLVARPDTLVRVLAQLALDEEPEIRAAVARQLPDLARALPMSVVETKCVPVALHLGKDPDTVVRSSAVHSFASLLVLESEAAAMTVCEGVVRLMEDPSFAVQVEAIRNLEHVIAVLSDMVRTTEERAADGATASGTGSEGATSGKHHHHSHHTRSSSTSSSRRRQQQQQHPALATVAAAHHRSDVVVGALTEPLRRMRDAGNWRVRDAVVHIIRYFCRAIPSDRFAALTGVIRGLLHDPVSEVRSRAVETLGVVAEHYGAEWAAQTAAVLLHEEFAPEMQAAYVGRLTAVQSLAALLPVVNGLPSADLRRQQLLHITTDLVRRYAADRVPNVRIAIAKAMPRWRQWFAASSPRRRETFNEALAMLQADADEDVAVAAADGHPIPCPTTHSAAATA